MSLKLHIILQKPPAGIHFALQKGHGNNFEIVEKKLSDGGDLLFDLTIDIKAVGKADEPQFGGPFVQGPTGEKFIYIGIGTFAGQPDSPWDRRLKIPLRDISWQMVNEAMEKAGLETIVPGTARDGTPTRATVKPFGGWKVNSQSLKSFKGRK